MQVPTALQLVRRALWECMATPMAPLRVRRATRGTSATTLDLPSAAVAP